MTESELNISTRISPDAGSLWSVSFYLKLRCVMNPRVRRTNTDEIWRRRRRRRGALSQYLNTEPMARITVQTDDGTGRNQKKRNVSAGSY